jgi:hypothetical protein
MDIIPIEYCDICEAFIHLHQNQQNCAFEHRCESGGIECPLKRFFSKTSLPGHIPSMEKTDMPYFYISDL